jgi:hypothetical protein
VITSLILELLYLSQNKLEGHIPDSLDNASMLQHIFLQSNNFTGLILSSFGKLLNLSRLAFNKPLWAPGENNENLPSHLLYKMGEGKWRGALG